MHDFFQRFIYSIYVFSISYICAIACQQKQEQQNKVEIVIPSENRLRIIDAVLI